MRSTRPTSAVILTLTLLTAECCCDKNLTAKSFRMTTKTQRTATSDHPQSSYVIDDQRPATLPTNRPPALFTDVRGTNFFPGCRRTTDEVDSESVYRFVFARYSKAAAWKSQRVRKTAGCWLIKSLMRGRASGGDRARHTQPADTDVSRRPEPAKRRRRPTIDDARRLNQQQTTWSISRDAVGENSRRQPPMPTDNLTSQGVRQETVNDRELRGWSGDPEVIKTSLFHKVNKDTGRKYFAGKRYRRKYDMVSLEAFE